MTLDHNLVCVLFEWRCCELEKSKQDTVANYTTKVEYIAASDTTKDSLDKKLRF